MYYSSVKLADCANGVGMRTCLFVSGCTHHCRGCFNPETWPFDAGEPYTKEVEDQIIQSMQNGCIDGLSILGGEPMEPENQVSLLSLALKTKRARKTLWIYSGYTFEELLHDKRFHVPVVTDQLLECADILVDGEFVEAEKDITLNYRGSRNQRIINVPESLRKGRAVLAEELM